MNKTKILWLIMVFCLSLVYNTYAQSTRIHIVQKSETAYRISKNYNISLAKLYEYNPEAKEQLRIGQKLIIPTDPSETNRTNSKVKPKEIYHAVEKGETLFSIARQYGVSVAELRNPNPAIKDVDILAVGIILKIPSSSHMLEENSSIIDDSDKKESTPTKGLKLYTIKPGETIYSLLKSTGWSEEELYQYNPALKNGLFAGQNIFIPDTSLPSYTTKKEKNEIFTPQFSQTLNVALALPFKDSGTSNVKKYVEFYEGVLLSIKHFKDRGGNINLYVVDSSISQMPNSIETLSKLERLDLLIGGLSKHSVEALLSVARRLKANYIIPFSSLYVDDYKTRDIQVFQVNPPKNETYRLVARKLLSNYPKEKIIFFESTLGKANKQQFRKTVEEEAAKQQRTVSIIRTDSILSGSNLAQLWSKNGDMLIIPTNSSKNVAQELLTASIDAQQRGAKMTVIGYPEWQTFESNLLPLLKKSNASFYTMFYVDYNSSMYKDFVKEFFSFYGRPLENIYPRYGLLGYDIMDYYLRNNNILNFKTLGKSFMNHNIQSKLEFTPTLNNKNVLFNSGIMFISYKEGKVRID